MDSNIEINKVENYLLIGCESDELYENSGIINLWSNKFINKEIEKTNFEISGWSF